SMNNQMRKWNPHVDVKDKPICYRCFNNPPGEGVCSYCPTIKTLKDGLVHEDVTETPMGDEVYNYRIISSPIKDSAGKVVAAVEMVEDITERKRTDERLHDYAVRLGYLTKYANDFIILLDENFRFLETNERVEDVYGYTHEELMSMYAHQLRAPEVKDDFAKQIKPLETAGRAVFETVHQRKDGTKFPVEISIRAVDIEGKRLYQAVIRDISERKLAEDKFRILFESSRDAIMILEPPSWKFTSGNPAMIGMFMIKSEEDIPSYGPWDLSPERQPDGSLSSGKAHEMIETAMRDGSNLFEWTHKRLDGKEFPANVMLTRVAFADKTILQATVRDITEQRKLEKEARKRLQDLEVFYKASIGREERILELKKEIETLKRERKI
ncbi:MAG: PAS domain S-box protein, partial [Candidatus Omnitrophota bacterium]